jgi:hypothetical protein
MTSKKTSIEK